MKKVVVYGAGAYANVFYYEVMRTKAIEIVAFAVDKKYRNEKDKHFDLPLIDFEECEKIYSPNQYDMIVMCGYTKMRDRRAMFERAKEKGYTLLNYVSPDAYVECGVEMGENNVIFSNAFVGANGKMGDGNIVRQNVYLGHEFCLGNHIIISSGCTLGGYCHIGDMSFIGLGVTAIDSIDIGKECLIGAASNVVKNIDNYAKALGNPVKIIDYHEETGVLIKAR